MGCPAQRRRWQGWPEERVEQNAWLPEKLDLCLKLEESARVQCFHKRMLNEAMEAIVPRNTVCLN